MMPSTVSPSLYGITKANSTRHGASLWGKNQFNSTFPLALCLWMRDHNQSPVTVIEDGGRIVANDTLWQMRDVIGPANCYYMFESPFDPYAGYCRDAVDNIDLVVTTDGQPLRPLEIKLTVVPDSGTASGGTDKWAPEMVMRPVSSAYAMMSVAASLAGDDEASEAVATHLRLAYNQITGWDNATEIAQRAGMLRAALDGALRVVAERGLQRPFLLQPLWRTEGQSFVLAEHCFDVFVWSDAAVMRVPVDQSTDGIDRVSRPLREVARHVRGLYDLLSTGDFSYLGIYKGMPLGHQTDKSFALGGRKSIRYLRHPRLSQPLLDRSILSRLVIGGGERELRPERRFDAAVVAQMLAEPGA
ncbi:MAG: HindVP family restriction endonuclease [Acidimicrobiaceae bacterium]|nr:HindVP family restriction endonuclease [Acidimicrobiaceae bacterium]MYJ80922.1 HindVP family restriction endonuclease [Acidimicrobiaceae bacterium]